MHIIYAKCNTILLKGGAKMFQIKPDKKETENKTIRFPLSLIQEIENAIQNKKCELFSFCNTSM